MKQSGWETLEERVKRHMKVPLKQKMEWLQHMLEFSSRNQLKLRKKVRLLTR